MKLADRVKMVGITPEDISQHTDLLWEWANFHQARTILRGASRADNILRYSREHQMMWAVAEGALVGYLEAAKLIPGDNSAQIHWVYVPEDLRRSDIGTTMVRAYEQMAVKAGYADTFYYAHVQDDHTIKFFESLGYKTVRKLMGTHTLKRDLNGVNEPVTPQL